MPPVRKPAAKRPAAPSRADVTKALDALNDAIERAQTAAKAVRDDLSRSTLPHDLARDVEKMVRDLRRDAGKLDRAVRAEIRKAVGASKPAAKKPAARKPAAKKAAAKPAAKKPAARKPAAKKAAAKPAAKKPAARKPAARKR